jgi:hypothetical protein
LTFVFERQWFDAALRGAQSTASNCRAGRVAPRLIARRDDRAV